MVFVFFTGRNIGQDPWGCRPPPEPLQLAGPLRLVPPIISHMMACQTHHLIVVEVSVGEVIVVLQTLRSSLRCDLTKGVSCIPTLCKVTP